MNDKSHSLLNKVIESWVSDSRENADKRSEDLYWMIKTDVLAKISIYIRTDSEI